MQIVSPNSCQWLPLPVRSHSGIFQNSRNRFQKYWGIILWSRILPNFIQTSAGDVIQSLLSELEEIQIWIECGRGNTYLHWVRLREKGFGLRIMRKYFRRGKKKQVRLGSLLKKTKLVQIVYFFSSKCNKMRHKTKQESVQNVPQSWWFSKMFLSIQDTQDTSFWKLCP